jgi:hypothetical protein
MGANVDRNVLLHALRGLAEPGEVPVGIHSLEGVEVLVRFPETAAITRAEGTAGGGFDSYVEKPAALSLVAVALFLGYAGTTGKAYKKFWRRAIKEAISLGAEAEAVFPAEALEALAELAPEPETSKRKTSARRIGCKEARICLADFSVSFSGGEGAT